MTFTITTGLIVFVVFVVFVLIARRVFRLALKFAFVGGLVILLLGGGVVGWWRGWFDSSTRSAPGTQRPASQTNQRSNSNRRPSR